MRLLMRRGADSGAADGGGADGGGADGGAREQLMLVRRRAVPAASYITRLTGTAVFAYLAALLLPGSHRPVLAALTALLVLQATAYQTIRSAIQRVAAVTCGVLVAIALSEWLPFNWLILGLLIAGTLAVGMALRLGPDVLEVPISAMLIFSSGPHGTAASRIADTLVGAAAGLVSALVFAPLRVEPARESVAELAGRMSSLLGEIADGLAEAPSPQQAAGWLSRSRTLRDELEQVEDTLDEAEDSVRLNPRRMLHADDPADGLREALDTLDKAAGDLRMLVRTIADSARIDSRGSPVANPETRSRLAEVLGSLSAAVRSYGQAIAAGSGSAAKLDDHLAEAHRRQDGLAEALRTTSDDRAEAWPLRGEILAQVNRLRTELEPSPVPRQTRRRLRQILARARGGG